MRSDSKREREKEAAREARERTRWLTGESGKTRKNGYGDGKPSRGGFRR